MRIRTITAAGVAAIASILLAPTVAVAQTSPISLQGRLSGVASGERDFTLTIWDAPTGGTAVHVAETTATVDDGLFTLLADLPESTFGGGPRWWSVSVDGGDPSARLLVASVPMAHSAANVGDLLRVVRAPGGAELSIVGGFGHSIADTADGGVIAGGEGHTLNGSRGAIGGGAFNRVGNVVGATVAGGTQNSATGPRAFVGGGEGNTASANRGAIAGGSGNALAGDYGFIGSGISNRVEGRFSSILAGRDNLIVGEFGSILGGRDSMVLADYGLAFGNQAVVSHDRGIVFAPSNMRFETTGPDQFLIQATGGVGIGTNAPRGALEVRGTTRTSVLVISGGSDLAEPFPASPQQAVEPRAGMVLSIDPENPGALRVSTESYDTKVAGVYSGGNGLPTGMLMGKDGCELTSDGEDRLPLAMTGRVWVYADDSGGEIRPGDRLTTSGVNPGFAARVDDDARSIGAVIGKAMTGIDEGTGMVLVLVNLQ